MTATQNKLYMSYRESRTGGEPEDPDEKWTSYTPTYIEFHPEQVFLQEQRFQETIEVSWAPTVDAQVWILVVRYQTGSTFGTSHGNWTIIGAYDNQETPAKIAEIIKQYPENEPELQKALKGYLPEKPYFYARWIGYFEQLEDIEIHQMTIRNTPGDPPAFKSIWHS